MQIRSFNAPSAPQGFHAQVCAVEGATRLAFVSGQVPATAEGAVPESLAEQSRLIWRNIEAQLAEVGMSLDNVVKATTFLSDRKYAIENREIRNEVMGARTPAITVIICDLFDEAWLLEIEVMEGDELRRLLGLPPSAHDSAGHVPLPPLDSPAVPPPAESQ